jgi:hypothetical protein
MFTDPQSVTISGFNGGAAISLPRTSSQGSKSIYTSNDGLYSLTISHQVSGTPNTANFRTRSMFRLDVKVLATDPFNADKSIYQTFGVYIVLDKPAFGFTATQMVAIVTALVANISASTYAAATKLVGNEH